MADMRGEIRFSSILVDEADGLRIYRSFEDVPEETRKRILAAMDDGNSGTVVIADRRARARMPAPQAAPVSAKPRLWQKRAVLEIVAGGALVLVVWMLATLR
jgi:hypothetical protein